MDKKKMTGIVSWYGVIYPVITLLNSVLYLCSGICEDPSGNWHELDRAIILLIGFAAFGLCTSLTVKPLILRYVIAYIPSQLLAFAYVWFTGLREPLAKSAYQDIWISFTRTFCGAEPCQRRCQLLEEQEAPSAVKRGPNDGTSDSYSGNGSVDSEKIQKRGLAGPLRVSIRRGSCKI